MTPHETFDQLIEGMEADNGCTFDVTPAQRARGEAIVATMIANGWNPEGVTPGLKQEYQYVSDIEALSQGEYSDTILVAERWGGQELNTLLNQIFGEDE